MSVLDTPRIYFRGQITWDPIVTNNSPNFYDIAASRPVMHGSVADYREQARLAILPPGGNWNPHGTHRSTFFETFVSGVDRGKGLDRSDQAVGVPVTFTGMLVDLNPYGATTSQLYFDELSCGIDGGSQILASRAGSAGPVVARRINFKRNSSYHYTAGGASVIWQASFATGDGVAIHPRGSGVLGDLAAKLGDTGDYSGLTVRFNTYRTVYYGTQKPGPADFQALADEIAAGGFHPNPARSEVVGVIGLWRPHEPASVAGDRILLRAQQLGAGPSTAFAKVVGGNLVIDLGNSIPETGFNLAKKNLGVLSVFAKGSGGETHLGDLPFDAYRKHAYRATSGLVTLPLGGNVAAATRGDLMVRDASGNTLLAEQTVTVFPATADLYLEAGESEPVELRAFERGGKPTKPVTIDVVEVGGPLPGIQLAADGEGKATLPLQGGKPGGWSWVLTATTESPAPKPQPVDARTLTLNADTFEYVTLRTLPPDADLAALPPTWENVYQHVLRYWEALAPCMDNWLVLSDEEQVTAYAPLVKRLTSRDNVEAYRYMPVTRDLTPGQRTLLHRWCDSVMGKAPARRAAAAARPAPAVDEFGRGF